MSMTETDVICREAAEAALRRYGGQFRREGGETLHIGSCGDAVFSVDHDGTLRAVSIHTGCAFAVSEPGGQPVMLDGFVPDPATVRRKPASFDPVTYLEKAIVYADARLGSVIASRLGSRFIVSLTIEGRTRIFSKQLAKFIAVSRPAGSLELDPAFSPPLEIERLIKL